LLAAKSYLLLFIIDTSASLVTALLIYLFLAETRPPSESSEPQVSTVETFKNYRHVFADRFFIFFMLATALMVLVYTQMQGPLAVFLRDYHGLPEQGFGYILSLNAGMVVLMQFWITRKIEHLPPFLVLAAGTLFYVVGFGMYGIVAAYPLFLLAMAIITLGEMLTAPVGSAVAAQLAPESMRGRYMAVYGFSWMVPGAVGMYLAGLIFDNYDPRLVWYASALVGVIAALAFLGLHLSRTKRLEPLLEAAAAGIDG
jgi:predicted MFS family arabinose efflux permease